MQKTLIAPLTQNAKLGAGVATTYRPVGDAALGSGTCPSTCPLLPANGGACYTKSFLVNRQQRLSNDRHDDLDRLLLKKAKLVRLHTSGDFFTADGNGGFELDVEYIEQIIDWCRANPEVIVWTYTHAVKVMVAKGFSYKLDSFPENLRITASVESDEERAFAKAAGFRTARVIDAQPDKKTGETLCPYDLALSKGVKPKTTCAKCQLCFNPKHKHDIAFIKH